MMWKKCTFLTKVEGDPDKLGNPTVEWTDGFTTEARTTPWINELIALEKRNVTKNQRWFAVRALHNQVKDYERVRIDDTVYEIIDSEDLEPRYTLIQGRRYKT